MAFTPTESTDLPDVPAPLSFEALGGVPGTLGEIARRRFKSYEGTLIEGGLREHLFRPRERPSFRAALEVPGISVIAEVKRSSPSQGTIADLDPIAAAQSYSEGGAAAVSVLTEPDYFGGDLRHLAAVAEVVELPLLRKDFVLHPAQVSEARRAGASAVLLIVALLGEATGPYLRYAAAQGLDALVEVHDEKELDLALAAGADIIGVYNRDLRTLQIDLDTAPRLIGQARTGGFSGVLVAESGYRSPAEIRALRGVADAVLVGTSVAGSSDLAGAVAALVVAGRS